MSILGTYYGATLLNGENTNIKNKIKLEYYVIEEKLHMKAKEDFYGISIIKKEYEDNKIRFERQSVEKIATTKNRIKEIVEILKNCKVTPIALEDVLEDLLKKSKYQMSQIKEIK